MSIITITRNCLYDNWWKACFLFFSFFSFLTFDITLIWRDNGVFSKHVFSVFLPLMYRVILSEMFCTYRLWGILIVILKSTQSTDRNIYIHVSHDGQFVLLNTIISPIKALRVSKYIFFLQLNFSGSRCSMFLYPHCNYLPSVGMYRYVIILLSEGPRYL